MKAKKLGESIKSLKAVVIAVYVLAAICLPISFILNIIGILKDASGADLFTLIANILAALNLLFLLSITGVMGIRVMLWMKRTEKGVKKGGGGVGGGGGEGSKWRKRIYRKSVIILITDIAFLLTLMVLFLSSQMDSELPGSYFSTFLSRASPFLPLSPFPLPFILAVPPLPFPFPLCVFHPGLLSLHFCPALVLLILPSPR